jgi:signal transduction histidine kinase
LNTFKAFYTNTPRKHPASTGAPEGHLPIQRFLSVPVLLDQELVGQIALANKNEDYTDKDLDAIRRMAEFYALAVQRNRTREALQKAKGELEKRVKARTAELTITNTKLKKEIQERKLVEVQLQNSKSMLQSVFDGISDPLVLLDKDLRMKMLNKAAKDYYRLDKYQDVIGKQCHAAIRERLEPCKGCKVPEAVSKDQHLTWERPGFIDPDRLEQVIAYPVQEIGGEFGGTIIRISDITEEKLRQRQLIQRERLASLGLLVSGIAHEVNNPNNFISFNIPILRDYMQALIPMVDAYAGDRPEIKMFEMPYPEFRDDLFKILTNIEHGSTRINTIVSGLKRFSGKRGKEEKQWIDLKQVIEKTVAISRGEIKKNIRSFEIDIPDDLPNICTDPEVIEQIVINLLINAAQAADKEDSWVKLRVAMGDTWKDHVCIEVRDNGCGMDEKITKNIFNPFFTTKEAGVGTGLGLYVCNDLIKGLGGRIEVESKVGEGSSFSVILPGFERRSMKRLDG